MFFTPRSFVPEMSFLKRLHLKSFVLGLAVMFATTATFGYDKEAEAIDFNAIAKSISNLVKIKKNLDGDVKSLTADAKNLFGDKDNLVAIKDQLIRLATETKAQIDSVQTKVQEVDGHIKAAQANIVKTSKHVDEIDDVRTALEGK